MTCKLKVLSILFVFALTMTLSAIAVASGTFFKIDKYSVGINYSPLSACAVWIDEPTNTYIYRYANAEEYISISSAIFGLTAQQALSRIETQEATRELTAEELDFCRRIRDLG